jgi:CHASE2 domain-containing sensor protein/two-component sensor histidine kinase
MSMWRISILPGIAAITVISAARMLGSLQSLELATFDIFMRLRPNEPIDERILIVGINEKDIQSVKTYPIPDKNIAQLLRKLQNYQPAAIGLDIYRDLDDKAGNAELATAVKEMKNFIGVEKILPDISGMTVNPPLNLPEKQVGFVDTPVDRDAKQRRSLVAASNFKNQWRNSLSLKLVETYLANKGISLQEVRHSGQYIMKFNSTKLPPFASNSGGYIAADDGGYQMLINFRSHPQPFRIVSLEDIINNKVNKNWINGKIVLIGITSPSAKDYAFSSAIKSKNAPIMYGVELHAHAISQLLSGVLDRRPFINSWLEIWEYIWMIAWAFGSIELARKTRLPITLFLSVSITIFCLIFISYILLICGWWVPVIPPLLLILIFNGIGTVLAAFYRYDESWKVRFQYRQLVIDETFDTIHNGPLQTLARIVKQAEDNEQITPQHFLGKLQQLNQELRDVYELLKKESLINSKIFYISKEQDLDLQRPIHEILQEIYIDVLEKEYPCFPTIRIKVTKFEPLDEKNLKIELKRGICRFLEEALCNVGKYAQDTTRLEVICYQKEGKNIIIVTDNGLGVKTVNNSSHQGFGTQRAQTLAKQLGGEFQRYPNSPQGTVCQLTWSAKKNVKRLI